jgi:hypothetical protein
MTNQCNPFHTLSQATATGRHCWLFITLGQVKSWHDPSVLTVHQANGYPCMAFHCKGADQSSEVPT